MDTDPSPGRAAPDGLPWRTPPWVGGEFEGGCGASQWVEDPDGTIQEAERTMGAFTGGVRPWQPKAVSPLVEITQMAWFRAAPGTGDRHGFRVECRLRRDHDGDCDFPHGPSGTPGHSVQP